ncbi:MAG TPA: DNA translocase FtsK 4TM domain-containing protein [Acidimicrobiia bacterium]|nr:DNA translocase FtsK 4TM domain-containing protein [Acidimicrobiia bacterium]
MASRTKRRAPAKPARAAAKSTRPATPARPATGAPKPIGRLRAHRRQIGGVGLLVLAGVGGLGIWLGVAGAAGDFLAYLAGGAVGLGMVLVPLVLAAFGVALLRQRDGELGRLAAGGGLASTGSAGLLYLLRPASSVGHGLEGWRRAGGVLGAVVGNPLRSLAGPWGAGLILAALAFVGFLILFRLSFDQVYQALRRAAVALWHALGGGLRRLTTLSDRGADEADDAGSDVLALDRHTVATAPTRRRRAGIDHLDAPPPADDDAVEAEDADLTSALTVDLTDDDDTAGDAGGDTGAALPTGAPGAVATGEDLVLQSLAFVGQPAAAATQLELGLVPAEQRWKLPPDTALTRKEAKPIDRKLVEKGGETLEATLLEFGVDAHLVGMTIGPTVTRYELELGPGVKVNKVTSLSHDIAYAMASPDVRIIAPIPGRSAIGVEVPNRQRQLVNLGDILVAEEGAKPVQVHPLEVGLGRDIAGRPFSVNLATMPHLLIAGATGAGKSSCINSLITSILMRATPDQVRLILIDPKRVELGQYNDVPHLLTPVVVNPKKAANALDWAVREMELRYDLLAEVGVRDITGYNAAFDRGDLARDPLEGGTPYERLPFIVVVVDELADLMMVAARDVETSICRIAQMARAVGIHLVIATQRPSVDVITGVIKANVPSRLAFSVSSLADSRVILDTGGAEKLIGKGDMLLLTASSSRPARIQGAWVEESDVHKVVAHWRRQTKELHYVQAIQGDGAEGATAGAGDSEGDDDLLDEAMELIVRSGLGSTSMLQRKLRVGFSRAGRLMDLLERRGVVGPSEGSKARSVLMTVEELEALPNR